MYVFRCAYVQVCAQKCIDEFKKGRWVYVKFIMTVYQSFDEKPCGDLEKRCFELSHLLGCRSVSLWRCSVGCSVQCVCCVGV